MRTIAVQPAVQGLLRPRLRSAPAASGVSRARTPQVVAAMAPQGEAGELDHEEYHSRWEGMWTKDGGLKPGQAFDAARASPALAALLQRGELEVAGKRVLVPGCGRGYDVALFARHGAAAAVGLELAPTAADEARRYLEGELSDDADAAARAAVHQGDFFKAHEQHPPFDLSFDYTFMCALHPGMRGDWAAAWARYLAPGGRLVCLAFPIDPARKGVPGPPWYVEPDHYHEHLTPHGFVLERHEAVPPELSHPGREGKEALLIYRRA